MVIQRDAPFQVWGIADTGRKVSVKVSWNSNIFQVTTDKTGTWKATIPAEGANNNPQTITCSSSGLNDIVLNNILIGDVWVCSGQSNMVMPVNILPPSFLGVLNYQDEIAAANYPNVRAITIPTTYSDYPMSSIGSNTSWTVCSPQTVGNYSAIAYYFAQKLNTSLNVPIGIIVSAVNGTSCQAWTNQEAFTNNGSISGYANNASQLYNGMISPLTRLSIKGFTWYQGENNEHDNPDLYAKLNSALIEGWRGVFNQGQLPFYFVQMTPFAEDYNNTNPPGGNTADDYYAKFREGQTKILAVPGTGMAVTMDVGEVANHHPRNKKPVGERLALLALKNDYHQNVVCYGPHYESYTASGNTVTIQFSGNTADGLNTINNQPLNQLFFLAGSDHVFHKGSAQIQGNTIVVTVSNDTPLPVQGVRYAFTNAPITNLQNGAGLPAEPFRTDNWSN
jgi:sialate O-acetylesterase